MGDGERAAARRPKRTTTLRVVEQFAAPPELVFALITSRDGFLNAMPPGVEVLAWPEHFGPGEVLDLRWGAAGVHPVRWLAEIDAFEHGRTFSDLQVRGPFRFWRHTHTVEPHNGGTRHTDTVEFSTGFGPAGDLVAAIALRGAFGPRLRRMHADLERS
ncbi:SRPBCC family protein [Nocardiopsis salina]|uniref:SRPBCC family protein n=1 Tax=Nocardiopsis salina TaxID=245836 RepID=UPI00034C8AAD|nr:SRPBCC family protein [Nocardiopsis salina]